MAWKKSSEDAVKRFVEALPEPATKGRRKMFGYEACFVAGNFWAGMYQDDVVIKLPDEVKASQPELARAARFDPMGGRPMKQWWVVPKKISANASALGKLLAATLPKLSNAKKKTRAKK